MSQPVDPEFEMLVIACVINLLEGLHKAKYKQTLEEDIEFINKAERGEIKLNHRE